jgi:predicted metal-dependent phosphoesterase TrpH
MHTTASDGRSTPAELAAHLHARGVTVAAVTDHDTTAAVAETRAAAAAYGIRVVTGIEITAVANEEDVHMLGYGFDPNDPKLKTFLEMQRGDRRRRLDVMRARLEDLGLPVNIDAELSARGASGGKALGRPMLAHALVRAGHVATVAEAFEKYLGHGRPAFVPREGASPAEVVALVHGARGLVSLAHPGKLRRDALIEPLAEAGLDAIEVFHPDHDAGKTNAYSARARRLNLLVTGGSDYHGPDAGRTDAVGRVTLPAREFEALSVWLPA